MVPAVVQAMWQEYAESSSGPAAAAAVGVDRKSAFNWIGGAGGIVRQGRHPSGKRLGFEDRCAIEAGLAVGETQTSIAARIGFDKSTVSRELGRGRLASGRYSAKRGQAAWVAAGKRPKPGKLATNPRLRARVEEDLGKRYSPEQIAGRLRRDFPDDPEMQVHPRRSTSRCTCRPAAQLRADLHQPTHRAGARKPRQPGGPRQRRGRIPDMVNISERPPEVADRPCPGTGKAT